MESRGARASVVNLEPHGKLMFLAAMGIAVAEIADRLLRRGNRVRHPLGTSLGRAGVECTPF
jgi:hypothetical protein